MTRTAALFLHPPLGKSAGERLVGQVRQAAALDLIPLLHQAGMEDVLVLGEPAFTREAASAGARPLPAEDAPFHFGEVLKRIIHEEDLDGLVYFGSGSGVLLDLPRLRRLARFVQEGGAGAVLNNPFSCDFAAIAGAKQLLAADLPRIDNPLGLALSDAGVPVFALPRDAASQFDIDTPTDAVLLRAAGKGGPHLRTALEEAPSHPFLSPLLAALADRGAHVLLVWRVHPETWSLFERTVACRTSALVEGRGFRSYPDRPGTLVGSFVERLGPQEFLREASRRADALLLDTRPLLSRGGELPPAADRFASDLLLTDQIGDPVWAEFTRAAHLSPVPLLLGGHSLISGGLFLLAEMCWKGRNLPRRLDPQTFGWSKEPG